MEFKRGIEPRKSLRIGQNSAEYIKMARAQMKSRITSSLLTPAEKFFWDIIDNNKMKMEVTNPFLIDPHSNHYVTEKIALLQVILPKKVSEGIYKIYQIHFTSWMNLMHPAIYIKFLDEREYYNPYPSWIEMICYPIALKRHCKLKK